MYGTRVAHNAAVNCVRRAVSGDSSWSGHCFTRLASLRFRISVTRPVQYAPPRSVVAILRVFAWIRSVTLQKDSFPRAAAGSAVRGRRSAVCTVRPTYSIVSIVDRIFNLT